MNFTYTDKAKSHILDNNIKNIFVKLNMPKGSCCGINAIRLDIRTEVKNKDKYKKTDNDLVDTYYDPQIDLILDKYDEVLIGVFGFGKMKKFVSQTEFNPVSFD